MQLSPVAGGERTHWENTVPSFTVAVTAGFLMLFMMRRMVLLSV